MFEIIFSALFSTVPVKAPEKPFVLPERALTIWKIEEVPMIDDSEEKVLE